MRGIRCCRPPNMPCRVTTVSGPHIPFACARVVRSWLLAVNGMSRYARDGRNSNSAVLVSIAASDTPDGQIELQRRYERAAFLAGGGRYRAPVQTVGDFMSGGVNALPSRVLPTYMGGGADKVTL